MKEPEIVPEKVSNPINIYIILGIILIGISVYVALNIISEENVGILAFGLSVLFSASVAIFAFIVSKQNSTGVLRKAYFFLGLGFSSYAIAEVLYYTFDLILNIEVYPSIVDVFFFALYPLLLGHLLYNIKFFQTKYTKFQKVLIPTIPFVALTTYAFMSLSIPDAEANFDFYYGFIFVFASSLTLSFTIIGASIFRQGAISVVWFLLLIGLMINAVADIWYYHLEIFGGYFDEHPVTVIWYIANMFIIYALYKHQKII